MLLADVGVPAPLAHSLTYLVPEGLREAVRPGSRVLCNLGRRKVLAVVLEVGERTPNMPLDRLRPIAALVDPEPALPLELLQFLQELARYYFAPIGEVLRLALPAVERTHLEHLAEQGQLLPGEAPGGARAVGGRLVQVARATDRVEAPGSLRGQAAAILAWLRAGGELPVATLQARHPNARAALKKLAAAGLVELDRTRMERAPLLAAVAQRDTPPALTGAQQEATDHICAMLDARLAEPGREARLGGSGALLFGITGSGKTEVYMRIIARCLAGGRGALVLVPEIALTPQLLGRFRGRFGDAVALLHSGLAPGDRHQMWLRLRSGDLRVAIGARSALFAPVRDLGLVVVDEEHDGSFKQEEGVRYHARDMALLRAYRAGALSVLGSATPSLESMALCEQGRLTLLRLPDRAHQGAELPRVAIVDLKRYRSGPTGHRLLSLPLLKALQQTLAAREQAIVFLNRRGFAPSVVCEACGTVATCLSCSVALTFHRRGGGRLRCHYCDFSTPLPPRCAACNTGELVLEGLGTEKLEDNLGEALPEARIARLDRDVASGSKSERILQRMRDGEIDVLVGTQMVTKGHDLPRVTLVGVVNADAALSMPDFRAAERGFSLLVQVAGRAGRHDRRGTVLIQTRDPTHPALSFSVRHDVAGFVEHELRDRREAFYPPFSRLALLRVDAIAEEDARRAAGQLAGFARGTPEGKEGRVHVLGPAPAPIARVRARYRFRVMLRSAERGPLRRVLHVVAANRAAVPRQVRVAIDVDPVSML